MDSSSPYALFLGSGWNPEGSGIFIPRCIDVLQTSDLSRVEAVLNQVEAKVRGGYVAFGYIAYETSAAFGFPIYASPVIDSPYVWFGFCPANETQEYNSNLEDTHRTLSECSRPAVTLKTSFDSYKDSIHAIKQLIAGGQTYQVNYTLRAEVISLLSGFDLFKTIYRSHPVPYAVWMKTGEREILSWSPELFLERRGTRIVSRPMKGTLNRGRTPEEDILLKDRLKSSLKDRAENVMILDMARNDLGRICRFGSVHTTNHFEIERYRSLFQMTSEVSGIQNEHSTLARIISAVFPAASITGAPKHRTMEIITRCEDGPRGIYCGAIGLIQPNGDFTFNVAIRTMSGREGRFELGVGGGIVWDSEPESEYHEIRTKMRFLEPEPAGFSLIETLLLDSERNYMFLNEHIDRLSGSAGYWDYDFDRDRIIVQLKEYAETIPTLPQTVRLMLRQDGTVSFTSRPVTKPSKHVRVGIAGENTDSSDRFLYHKTTHRELYNRAREEGLKRGLFEMLFINERGQVTEGTITNLFYRIGDRWHTPPLYDGLLPGVWRADFMNKQSVEERSLTREELLTVDELVIGNSVMGMARVDEIV